MARASRAAKPGSDHQLAWARAFVSAAGDEAHVDDARGLLDGSVTVDGLAIDTEFRWHVIESLAAAGALDVATIDAEAERDPTDAGLRHAAAARAARPVAAAKAAAWDAIIDPATALAMLRAHVRGFQQPDQQDLLAPYVEPYFGALGPTWRERGQEVALTFAGSMYPPRWRRPRSWRGPTRSSRRASTCPRSGACCSRARTRWSGCCARAPSIRAEPAPPARSLNDPCGPGPPSVQERWAASPQPVQHLHARHTVRKGRGLDRRTDGRPLIRAANASASRV